MEHHRATDALPFTIEPRRLVYARHTRKVARFDPPRLVAECPMPACDWSVTAPDSPAGSALACVGRARHAIGDHPEAVEAGMLVLAPAPYEADEAVDRVRVLRAEDCPPMAHPGPPHDHDRPVTAIDRALALDPAYGLADPIGHGTADARP